MVRLHVSVLNYCVTITTHDEITFCCISLVFSSSFENGGFVELCQNVIVDVPLFQKDCKLLSHNCYYYYSQPCDKWSLELTSSLPNLIVDLHHRLISYQRSKLKDYPQLQSEFAMLVSETKYGAVCEVDIIKKGPGVSRCYFGNSKKWFYI